MLSLISIFIFFPLGLFGGPLVTNNNTVRLTWTAPGDDYDIGRAAYYDIRYSTQPVGADTSLWWDSAIQIDDEPTPAWAGSQNSCLISNLYVDQHYYFAVKAADEALNWSGISKIAELPKVSCGDVNGDDAFDYLDLTYLLDFLYGNGQPPVDWASGDVDGSGELNVADAIYIINYRLNSGPPPNCGE